MLVRQYKTNRIQIRHASDAYMLICDVFKKVQLIDRDKEHFYVIGLKTNNYVRFVDLISIGSLTYTLAYGREIFRVPILKPVSGIILAHNHPSGNKQPSKADKELTEKMVMLGKALDIHVLDHIIFTENYGFYSFTENNDLHKTTP